MATTDRFSISSFCAFGNKIANTENTNLQTGVKTFLKKEIAKSGYPTCKEELSVIDDRNDIDVTPILENVPDLVSQYMHTEKRAFDIPPADDKTCPATIKVVAKDKETKTGIKQFGDHKGEEYKTTIAAHEELVVKNKRDKFTK